MDDWRQPFLETLTKAFPHLEETRSLLNFLAWNAAQGNTTLPLDHKEKYLKRFFKEENLNPEEELMLRNLFDIIPSISFHPVLCLEQFKNKSYLTWTIDQQKERELSDFFTHRLKSESAREETFKHLSEDMLDEEQKIALQIISSRNFAILTGGPGTGKTHVISSFLTRLNPKEQESVAVSAPTGRAASRVNDQLSKFCKTKAVTLHSLLGLYPGYGTRKKFGPENFLPYSTIIVDEASMIDVEMMLELTHALSPETRLVLVGDPMQLPSITSGAVFRDLVDACLKLSSVSLAQLKTNHRVSQGEGAKELAEFFDTVRNSKGRSPELFSGKTVKIKELPTLPDLVKIEFEYWKNKEETIPQNSSELRTWLEQEILLLPNRRGKWGVENFQALLKRKFTQGNVYHGMPLIVRSNQKALGISNGDRGIVVKKGENWAALFPRDEADPLILPLTAIHVYEPGYALTIHKSQGSEYARVKLFIHKSAKSLLTHELFYTAVTRARREIDVFAQTDTLSACFSNSTSRATLLSYRIFRSFSGELYT